MCDEIDCDSCCDNGCDDDCCCCCNPSTTTASSQHENGATLPGCGDHDCFFYLCCAGCFLCPMFYVGFTKRAEEPIPTPIDAAPVATNTNTTVAATTMTFESTMMDVPESKLLNVDLPITIIIDPEKLNSIEHHENDSMELTPPMDRT